MEVTATLQELELWKAKVIEAENEKSRLILEKMDCEDQKKKFQKETIHMISVLKEKEAEHLRMTEELETLNSDAEKRNRTLRERIKAHEDALKVKTEEYCLLQQQSKVKTDIPEKKVKFAHVIQEKDAEKYDYETTESQFTISQKPCLLLRGGQALITFEEDKVAEKILMLPNCCVLVDNKRMDVKPVSVTLEPSVKFQIHFSISKRKIKFSDVPPVLDENRMRDRLELSFSKPSLGGGEVEELAYDKTRSAGHVTFLNTGVAESLCLKKKYTINVGEKIDACIQPYFDYELKQFQTFCGVPKRTVLLEDIKDFLDEEDMQDHLEIYFQKPSNFGGEVDAIKYTSKGGVKAYFSDDMHKPEA
ncbi:N-myc-interactor [Paramormyrops kingsleyae]|uniref:N-myc-interactor n=1 Tax=Paramormyrops kingsleyae TaxID=1676925 RepID=UPI003B977465